MTDLQAWNTQHARGERCSVPQYLTTLVDTQVQPAGLTSLSNKQYAREAQGQLLDFAYKALANFLKNWSYKQYGQHMRWYSQEPQIVAYLDGPQEVKQRDIASLCACIDTVAAPTIATAKQTARDVWENP